MQFLVAAQTVSFKFVNRCYFSITSYRCRGYPAHGPTADLDDGDPTKHDMAREKKHCSLGSAGLLGNENGPGNQDLEANPQMEG